MRPLRPDFIKASGILISVRAIDSIDLTGLEGGRIMIHHNGMDTEASGTDAIEAVMALKPSAFEGRRLKWDKGRWALHNLVGHPVMQMLASLHFYKAAIWVHDATVPAPRMPIPKGPAIK